MHIYMAEYRSSRISSGTTSTTAVFYRALSGLIQPALSRVNEAKQSVIAMATLCLVQEFFLRIMC